MKQNKSFTLYIYFALILLALAIPSVSAHTQEHLIEAKQIIDSNMSCSNLSDEQLNILGDYYMEQIHPGEAHELMHSMMGGDDSELTTQMHIKMAKSIYCKEGSMMGGMGMMAGSGMKGIGSGMMGTGSWYNWGYSNFINILYSILLIGIIILVYLVIIKLLKNKDKRKK